MAHDGAYRKSVPGRRTARCAKRKLLSCCKRLLAYGRYWLKRAPSATVTGPTPFRLTIVAEAPAVVYAR
jgi:hypothetical protein